MDLQALLAANVDKAVLIATRVGMLMVFAPFFGSTAIPMPVKAGLTVAVTAVLLPLIHSVPAVTTLFGWVQMIGGEALVGLAIGLVMAFAFEGIEMAGTVAGFQLGYSMETSIDPTTQAASPVLAVFYQMLALLFFLQLGMHRWMLLSLSKSYSYLPIGAAGLSKAGMLRLMQASGSIFVIGIELAAPILLATVLTDLSLGFINKASPQFPVVFTSISIKILVGIGLIVISLGFWPGLLGGYFSRALVTTVHVLHVW
ncbi:MAG: flagellar biosynthetic protein FliR [Acidobacteriota bacterium]|nr:flagellar biosynthetic protein FliR [Acidobacteriota bacterium]